MNTEEQTFYRRHLPHYQPLYATFFVTFRLAGSLPKEVVIQLKEEERALEEQLSKIDSNNDWRAKIIEQRKKYFAKFDKLLDVSRSGPVWLRDERVARIVVDAIHYRDGRVYELLCYCIMPNHVHLVFDVERYSETVGRRCLSLQLAIGRRVSSPYIVTNIIGNLKWYTALEVNKILGRTGPFWQHESYDHVIRDGKEFGRIISYVLNNPVNAGFVNDWKDWKWSYCKEDFL